MRGRPAVPRKCRPLSERFWEKVDKRGPDECWPWLSVTGANGYGRIKEGRVGSRYLMAHRAAYELVVGPIPEGLTLDHLCRVRNCVNPAHLEPVTQRENTLRGVGPTAVNARKTRCPQGHPYDDANTTPHGGGRECRACRNAYKRRKRAAA